MANINCEARSRADAEAGSCGETAAVGEQCQVLGQVVQDVADALERAGVWFGHGTDNAWDEACWLTAAALELDPGQPLEGDKTISSTQRQTVDHWLQRRIETREPMAYMTGEAWFAGLRFEVNASVLIPRSPIAELIADGLPLWPLAAGDRVLDLCTGSGCIAIAIALRFPDVQVAASDLSSQAVAVARRNVAAHGLLERCKVVEGHLFEPVSGTYRLIVSNPPYVSDAEYEQLPAEYRHEPGMALRCDGEGLDLPLKILHDAPDYLTSDGHLILETGNSAAALEELLGTILAPLRPAEALTWLSFEYGGGGVAAISAHDLARWQPALAKAIGGARHVQ
ncbi:MAG: 50S ribosomal protein L3 N(5)-glutamine methyltransferase [Lysobacterales bacterium]